MRLLMHYIIGLLLLPQLIIGADPNQEAQEELICVAPGPTQINPSSPAAKKQRMLQIMARIIQYQQLVVEEIQEMANEEPEDEFFQRQLHRAQQQLGLLQGQFQIFQQQEFEPAELESHILNFEERLQQLQD